MTPMDSNPRTLFLTCANEPYYHFVVPFLFSIFKTQEDSFVEIFLNDKTQFTKDYKKSLNFIQQNISENFKLTEVDFGDAIPNTVRFIHEPVTKAKFVYISDIDIFFTDKNITDIHLKLMSETGQDFSNIVRPNTTKLTGLHFTKWDSYYPLPMQRDATLDKINDEMALYLLVTQKTGKEPRKDLDIGKFRPVHGIHCSPNRTIDSKKISWGINEYRIKRWKELTGSQEWKDLLVLLDPKYQNIVRQIDNYSIKYFNL